MSIVNLAGLNLPAELLPEILTDISTTSAFQTATTKLERLPMRGAEQIVVGGRPQAFVQEGAPKPTSSNLSSFKIQPHKMASIFVLTTEVELTAEAIIDAVLAQAPSDFALSFDNAVAGVTSGVPTENFANLGAALGAGTAIADLGDAAKQIGAVATSGGRPSHFVLSETLFWDLGSKVTNENQYVFGGLQATTPNIQGIPVLTFDADGESVGFVGDFQKKARWGVAVEPFVRFDRSGTITDTNGVTHNLAQENKLAVFVEGFYGFNVLNTKHFKKIVGAPAA